MLDDIRSRAPNHDGAIQSFDASTVTHARAGAGDSPSELAPALTLVHAAVVAFEAAWRAGVQPPIDAFLPPIGPQRVPIALELALIDMQWRVRAGLPGARPDNYLSAIPELAADPAAEAELRRYAATLSTAPHPTDPTAEIRAVSSPPGYAILGRLGIGGMGVVYKARQLRLNRLVALKMVLSGEHAGTQHLIRFLGEAEAAAAVTHAHVVRVYESGQYSGCPYLVMEYLDGGTLADRLKATGPLPPRVAAEIIGKVARGVQAAHELSIVHRDLKPSNVLFDQAGEPKVTDFGLAKRGSSSDLTATGALLGTPDYMAPEQASGRGEFVGPPADVWAIGVVLHECLTGRRPFAAPDLIETLRRVREDTPTPFATSRSGSGGIPRDLRLICAKCLEKNPAHRYSTAKELADDLDRFLANEPISARAPGPIERVVKWARRKPTRAVAVAAVASLLATVVASGVTLAVWRLRTAEQTVARQRAQTQRLEEEEQKTRAALRASLEVSTRLVLNDLAETGDAARGSVWLAHALEAAGAGADNLERVDRINLALWSHHVHALQWVYATRDRGPVQTAALSPDGTRVAAAFRDGTVVLWASSGGLVGKPFQTLPPVFGLEFAPDCRSLVVIRREVAEVWDLEKPECRAEVRHPGGVWASVFSSDGTFLVTAGEDRLVRVTNTRTDADLYPPLVHGGAVHAVAVSPDGTRILTGCWDRHARLWDAATGKIVGEPWKHAEKVQAVAFAPDGKTAATGSWNGTVQLWNPPKGTPVGAPLLHPPDPVSGVAFSPDGRTLLSWTGLSQGAANRNNSAHLWETRQGRHIAILPHIGPVQAARWNSAGNVLTGGFDGTARLWDASGQPIGAPMYHRDPVRYVGTAPDGRTLLTADTSVRLWRAAEGFPGTTLAHGSPVEIGLFGPDGRLVFTGGDRGGQLWDAATGKKIGEAISAGHAVWGAAFSPDGSIVVTGGGDGVARLWGSDSGREIGHTARHAKGVMAIAVAPRGGRLLTGSEDGTAGLWDGIGGRIGEALAHGAPIRVAAFSPDGRFALTGGADGSVRFWDAETGLPVHRALNHGARLTAVAFAPDGNTVLTAGADGSVRVWDVAKGVERTAPLRHDGPFAQWP